MVTAAPKAVGYFMEITGNLFGLYNEQWLFLMRSITEECTADPELVMDDNGVKLYKFGEDYMFLLRSSKQRKKM